MWLLPPAHRSTLLKVTFLGSFNAGTEVWRRREEYFAAEFEAARGLILGEGGEMWLFLEQLPEMQRV